MDGSGRLWGVEQEDWGGRFVNLREKCNSPQVKIFPRGSCWVGRCLCKRENCESGCKMMSVMLMWVLQSKMQTGCEIPFFE